MKRPARHYDGSSPVSFPLAGWAAIGAHRRAAKPTAPALIAYLVAVVLVAIGLAFSLRAYECMTRPAPRPSPAVAPTPPVEFRTPDDGGRMRGLETIEI